MRGQPIGKTERKIWASDDATGFSLLRPGQRQLVASFGEPILVTAIDTEEEFNWNRPFLRSETSVVNVRNQIMAQAIFDNVGVQPIYLVDHAVATQPEASLMLREIADSGRCEIGAHLHPWINPPFVEEVSSRTSFAQNLPFWLQEEKLRRLTDAITTAFGRRPITYRAGRYGVGEEVAEILGRLGYQIDMSVQPGLDMRRIHGPDFRGALAQPYWFGPRGAILEIPANTGFTGLIAHRVLPRGVPIQIYKHISKPSLNRFRSLGAFAHLRLLERIPMSPEGTTLAELKRLTYRRLSEGDRVFVLSYHSSSLLPGCTEYVRTKSELSRFLYTIEGYLEFFMGEVGGRPITPRALRRAAEPRSDLDTHRSTPPDTGE